MPTNKQQQIDALRIKLSDAQERARELDAESARREAAAATPLGKLSDAQLKQAWDQVEKEVQALHEQLEPLEREEP